MIRAVAGILIHNNKILIGKKIIADGVFCSGGWHLPGGHLANNESEESAIKREFKEETNLDVEIIKKLVTQVLPDVNYKIAWFVLKPLSFIPIPNDDLTDIQFVLKKDVASFCDKRAVQTWPAEVVSYIQESYGTC